MLKSKHKVVDKFIHYKNKVKIQLNRKIKAVRSDWGGEYEIAISDFCASVDIVLERTTPYTPQLNGIVERKKSWR